MSRPFLLVPVASVWVMSSTSAERKIFPGKGWIVMLGWEGLRLCEKKTQVVSQSDPLIPGKRFSRPHTQQCLHHQSHRRGTLRLYERQKDASERRIHNEQARGGCGRATHTSFCLPKVPALKKYVFSPVTEETAAARTAKQVANFIVVDC